MCARKVGGENKNEEVLSRRKSRTSCEAEES